MSKLKPVHPGEILRLGRYFGTSPQFWMNLQARYDLEMQKDVIGGELHKVRTMRAA